MGLRFSGGLKFSKEKKQTYRKIKVTSQSVIWCYPEGPFVMNGHLSCSPNVLFIIIICKVAIVIKMRFL